MLYFIFNSDVIIVAVVITNEQTRFRKKNSGTELIVAVVIIGLNLCFLSFLLF